MPGRRDGWIAFTPQGALLAAPRPEAMRIVVQVPRARPGEPGEAVVLWGHGSGGDAYEAVQRTDPANDLLESRSRLAARSWGARTSRSSAAASRWSRRATTTTSRW